MSDYEDYNNLAFVPGNWADTNPRGNTDRTQSTIELVEKIEQLTNGLNLKSEYIEKLEKENKRLKWWLREIVNNHRFTPISTAEKALKELDK